MLKRSQTVFLSLFVCIALACTSNVNESTSSELSPEHPAKTPLSETDRRRKVEIEKQMLAGTRLHDGALELAHIGDFDSVPALLIVLKENPPNSNGMMVCTAGHALSALHTITGANPGVRYEDWLAWWENYQNAKPPSEPN